ncbi:MAG: hypothetical protein IJX63_03815 [Lachnospiraceae bacterium]|nr:hypothetical protein [Lachnospiraceae bacterium]
MKKLLSLLLSLVLVFSLAGCGKEQTATYVLTSTEEGMQTMTDTQILKAKGDIVYEMKEITVVDISMADEETKALLSEFYGEYFGNLDENAPECVTMTSSIENDVFKVEIVIDLDGADLQELIDGGYLMADSSVADTVKAISFSQTCDGLAAAGYILQE